MSASTADVLDRAAELVEEKGWAQADDFSGICIDQAIGQASDELGVHGSRHAMTAVRKYLGINGVLFKWNDEPDRTKAEVVSALRATANVERSNGELG